MDKWRRKKIIDDVDIVYLQLLLGQFLFIFLKPDSE